MLSRQQQWEFHMQVNCCCHLGVCHASHLVPSAIELNHDLRRGRENSTTQFGAQHMYVHCDANIRMAHAQVVFNHLSADHVQDINLNWTHRSFHFSYISSKQALYHLELFAVVVVSLDIVTIMCNSNVMCSRSWMLLLEHMLKMRREYWII